MTIEKGFTIKNCLLGDIAKVTTRHKTDEGYLDVHADISRAGIYEYQAGELGLQDVDPAQIIRVLRTDKEVFNEQSMASFTKKPVTDEHPPAMIDSANARFYNVGQSGEKVVRDGNNLATTMLITDKKVVEKIEAGTVQLSCGYNADIVFGDGVDETHGPYNAIQKNIRGNHIAIVEVGRAGSGCKIKDNQNFNDNKGVTMLKVIVDGITIETTEQGKQAIDKIQGQLTDSNTALSDANAAHKTEIDKMTTDHKSAIDKLTGELEGTKKQVLNDEQLDAKVAERAVIVASASKIIKDFDPKGKSNADIKKAVVAAVHKDVDLEGKSDDFVDGMYSSSVVKFTKGGDNLENLHVEDGGDDGDAVEKARKAMIDRSANAYKSDKQKTA